MGAFPVGNSPWGWIPARGAGAALQGCSAPLDGNFAPRNALRSRRRETANGIKPSSSRFPGDLQGIPPPKAAGSRCAGTAAPLHAAFGPQLGLQGEMGCSRMCQPRSPCGSCSSQSCLWDFSQGVSARVWGGEMAPARAQIHRILPTLHV